MNNIPPVTIERNEHGLLNIDYKFKEDGTVDWFKMIDKNGVYIKPLKPEDKNVLEQKHGKLVQELDPIEDGVEEKYLAVTLFGLRKLAKIRGFRSLDFEIKESNHDYASVICNINWIGNYETLNEDIYYAAAASVVLETTNFMTKNFLVETASNRAEARAIRNFLGINVVSREELPSNASLEEAQEPANPSNPKTILNKKLSEKGFGTGDFEKLKAKLVEIGDNSFSEYTTYKDVPSSRYFELIGLLNKIK